MSERTTRALLVVMALTAIYSWVMRSRCEIESARKDRIIDSLVSRNAPHVGDIYLHEAPGTIRRQSP